MNDAPAAHRLRGIGEYALVVLAACLVLGIVFWFFTKTQSSPVPKDIRKAVSFKVYYPDQSKLPKSYALDKSSFRQAEGGVVLFSVSYGNKRSMVFSEQARPSQEVIEKFKASAIPVNNKVNVELGQAAIGAYGSGDNIRTVASLPINNGPWLIVTAPSDINQNELKQVIASLKK